MGCKCCHPSITEDSDFETSNQSKSISTAETSTTVKSEVLSQDEIVVTTTESSRSNISKESLNKIDKSNIAETAYEKLIVLYEQICANFERVMSTPELISRIFIYPNSRCERALLCEWKVVVTEYNKCRDLIQKLAAKAKLPEVPIIIVNSREVFALMVEVRNKAKIAAKKAADEQAKLEREEGSKEKIEKELDESSNSMTKDHIDCFDCTTAEEIDKFIIERVSDLLRDNLLLIKDDPSQQNVAESLELKYITYLSLNENIRYDTVLPLHLEKRRFFKTEFEKYMQNIRHKLIQKQDFMNSADYWELHQSTFNFQRWKTGNENEIAMQKKEKKRFKESLKKLPSTKFEFVSNAEYEFEKQKLQDDYESCQKTIKECKLKLANGLKTAENQEKHLKSFCKNEAAVEKKTGNNKGSCIITCMSLLPLPV